MEKTELLTEAARGHVALFNACVDSGAWAGFVATYTDDAVLEIDGAPGSPLLGRSAIEQFFSTRPPREHMNIDAITVAEPSTTEVQVTWDGGRAGRVLAQWEGSLVSRARLTS